MILAVGSLAFLRGLLTPDPLAEPFVVLLHNCALLLWLVNAMTEAFVYDHLHSQRRDLQAPVEAHKR